MFERIPARGLSLISRWRRLVLNLVIRRTKNELQPFVASGAQGSIMSIAWLHSNPNQPLPLPNAILSPSPLLPRLACVRRRAMQSIFATRHWPLLIRLACVRRRAMQSISRRSSLTSLIRLACVRRRAMQSISRCSSPTSAHSPRVCAIRAMQSISRQKPLAPDHCFSHFGQELMCRMYLARGLAQNSRISICACRILPQGGSNPPCAQGWQRAIRHMPIRAPRIGPYLRTARMKY